MLLDWRHLTFTISPLNIRKKVPQRLALGTLHTQSHCFLRKGFLIHVDLKSFLKRKRRCPESILIFLSFMMLYCHISSFQTGLNNRKSLMINDTGVLSCYVVRTKMAELGPMTSKISLNLDITRRFFWFSFWGIFWEGGYKWLISQKLGLIET